MKKSRLILFIAALLCLTMLLSSCGEIKNSLEKIVKDKIIKSPVSNPNEDRDDKSKAIEASNSIYNEITDDENIPNEASLSNANSENLQVQKTTEQTDETTDEPEQEDNDMTDAAPWPANFLKDVPELAGKIVDVLNENDIYVTVYLEYTEKAEIEAYIEELHSIGYNIDTEKIKSIEYIEYSAYNKYDEWIRVNADLKLKTTQIIMNIPEVYPELDDGKQTDAILKDAEVNIPVDITEQSEPEEPSEQ